MDPVYEFPSSRPLDTGEYSPLLGANDDFPEQTPESVQLSSEEDVQAYEVPDQPTIPDSVHVYEFTPSPTPPQDNPLHHLIILSPPRQDIQRSSAPPLEGPRERSWTMAVRPLRGSGVSPLGSRAKK